ncbi:hypothetical protein [Phnomibacter ginsenosidimutans]|uniref:Uncharacterized protein n=1 Tax=Phnomibacter ginsenosidimutans TaxID=2676868 RepID=A0A6I6G6W2_9BACT|nr:hypothetical protein [Phnomibacter ginsenosidimutans]QGW28416.1 hypothetical protein GLV81_10185 [Phnomibacter ginsenosidimutans]
MTNEELHKIINCINEQDLKRLATFGIFAINDDWDEIAIKANKEGLQLFALQLLRASQQTKDVLLDKGNNVIPLNSNTEWVDPESDIKISYVEQVDKTDQAQKVDDKKETFSDKSMKYGCFAILILLVLSIFVGLWTLVKWLF